MSLLHYCYQMRLQYFLRYKLTQLDMWSQLVMTLIMMNVSTLYSSMVSHDICVFPAAATDDDDDNNNDDGIPSVIIIAVCCGVGGVLLIIIIVVIVICAIKRRKCLFNTNITYSRVKCITAYLLR